MVNGFLLAVLLFAVSRCDLIGAAPAEMAGYLFSGSP
jgi:hypothetical protein